MNLNLIYISLEVSFLEFIVVFIFLKYVFNYKTIKSSNQSLGYIILSTIKCTTSIILKLFNIYLHYKFTITYEGDLCSFKWRTVLKSLL